MKATELPEAKNDIQVFWTDLNRQLIRLVRLQLAAFPRSAFHEEETTLARDLADIHSVYAILSGGIHFKHQRLIQQQQLFDHTKEWISDQDPKTELEPESALDGRLDAWQDTLAISMPPTDIFSREIQESNLRKQRVLIPRLQELADSGRPFDELFQNEIKSWGPTTFRHFLEDIARKRAISEGELQPSFEHLLPSPAVEEVATIARAIDADEPEGEYALRKAIEFLHSPYLEAIPFLRIQSLLYSAIVRKIAAGQKNIKVSIANDFEMIATLLPYCDAMFLDRECHALVCENPVRKNLDRYRTKLYSMRNRDEFLDYLGLIETNASRSHLDLVREVIGKA